MDADNPIIVKLDILSIQTFEVRQPIPPGQTWTSPSRGGLLLYSIEKVSLISSDGVVFKCNDYDSTGTGYAQFHVILIDGQCCVRSWTQSKECPPCDKYGGVCLED